MPDPIIKAENTPLSPEELTKFTLETSKDIKDMSNKINVLERENLLLNRRTSALVDNINQVRTGMTAISSAGIMETSTNTDMQTIFTNDGLGSILKLAVFTPHWDMTVLEQENIDMSNGIRCAASKKRSALKLPDGTIRRDRSVSVSTPSPAKIAQHQEGSLSVRVLDPSNLSVTFHIQFAQSVVNRVRLVPTPATRIRSVVGLTTTGGEVQILNLIHSTQPVFEVPFNAVGLEGLRVECYHNGSSEWELGLYDLDATDVTYYSTGRVKLYYPSSVSFIHSVFPLWDWAGNYLDPSANGFMTYKLFTLNGSQETVVWDTEANGNTGPSSLSIGSTSPQFGIDVTLHANVATGGIKGDLYGFRVKHQ